MGELGCKQIMVWKNGKMIEIYNSKIKEIWLKKEPDKNFLKPDLS